MTERDHDRRKFHRVVFKAPATVTTPGGRRPTRILDISLKGVLLEDPAGWPPETGTCDIELPLDDKHHIRMAGRVVRRANGLMGFEWVNIDVDSLTDLRRLLELNLGSDELINRDLSNLFNSVKY